MIASLAVTVAVAAASPAVEPEAPRYYFVLFGGQSVPFRPRTAHTWATFVKATPTADGKTALESFTISWLPAVGPVEPLRLHPVVGKNHTLDETFAIAERENARVSMWGPYEIDATRYELAAEQAKRLEGGAVRYRVIDSFRRPDVAHCVHAITYADPVLSKLAQPVLRVGEPGTSNLAARYARSGAFVGGPVTHDWLIPAVGLDRFDVIRRTPGERIPREFR